MAYQISVGKYLWHIKWPLEVIVWHIKWPLEVIVWHIKSQSEDYYCIFDLLQNDL